MTRKLRDNLLAFILILIVSIVPVTVRLNFVEVNKEESDLIRNSRVIADIFSYSKSKLIIFFAVIICVIYLIYFFTMKEEIDFNKFKSMVKKPVFYLSISYLLFVFLSSVCSRFKISCFNGISERYESMYVLFAYVIFFAVAKNCIKSPKQIKFLLYGLFFSGMIIFLIGFSQFIKKDFFVSEIGKKILLAGHKNKNLNINPVFDKAYSTLYNPNCLGLYCAMASPIFFSTIFFFDKKNLARYIAMILFLFGIINLFASGSTGGLIGFLLASGLFFVLFFMADIAHRLRNIFYLVSLIFLCGIMIFLSKPLKNKLNSMLIKFIKPSNNIFFSDLKINNNKLFIFYGNKENIMLEYKKTKIDLYKNNILLEPISFKSEAVDINKNKFIYSYDLKDNSIGLINITSDLEKIMAIKLKNITLMLGIDNNKLLLLDNKGTVVDLNKKIKTFGFKEHEFLASARGYIWARTLPLIKKYIIIGNGPDSFVFVFPQNDIIGKLKFYNSPYIIIDKPHNFYLQVIINTGLISCLCLVFIFINYFWRLFKFVFNNKEKVMINDLNKILVLRIGFASGIFGYLISSMGTDSVVSVAPLFWIILGSGFNINMLDNNNN